jgi:hypothetical protein
MWLPLLSPGPPAEPNLRLGRAISSGDRLSLAAVEHAHRCQNLWSTDLSRAATLNTTQSAQLLLQYIADLIRMTGENLIIY